MTWIPIRTKYLLRRYPWVGHLYIKSEWSILLDSSRQVDWNQLKKHENGSIQLSKVMRARYSRKRTPLNHENSSQLNKRPANELQMLHVTKTLLIAPITRRRSGSLRLISEHFLLLFAVITKKSHHWSASRAISQSLLHKYSSDVTASLSMSAFTGQLSHKFIKLLQEETNNLFAG